MVIEHACRVFNYHWNPKMFVSPYGVLYKVFFIEERAIIVNFLQKVQVGNNIRNLQRYFDLFGILQMYALLNCHDYNIEIMEVRSVHKIIERFKYRTSLLFVSCTTVFILCAIGIYILLLLPPLSFFTRKFFHELIFNSMKFLYFLFTHTQ